MQTTSTLPIQVNGAGPANPAQRTGNGNGNAEPSQFSATLSREMDQRRQPAPAAAAQPPARPQQPQQGAKAQQPAKAQQADKPAEKQAASAAQPEQAAADAAAAGENRVAQGGEGEDSAQQASAEASGPVADMLALVASFNQLLRAPVAQAAQGEAAAAATLQPGLPSASLETLTRNLLADAANGATAGTAGPDEAGALLPDQLIGKPLKAALADTGARQAFAPALEAAAQRAAAVQQAALPVQADTVAEAPLALQQAQQVQLQAAAAAAPANALPARVGTPAWDNQVGQKIVWMVAGGDQSAELTLNPPDLGPMQVVLNVSGDQASVTFTASQLEVRQALENALPRLREMMGESGITLGDASVNAGRDQRQAQDGQAGSGNANGARFAGADDAAGTDAARPAARTTMLGDRGMVDTFA